ncbi:MAG: GDP-mannose 4,6-dehydratase [Pseudarcicella sp.]|jgi:GDP-4-dehydro-6-deoxy-D-mannose reductase|nr:GDP-mannose 4,6-dehydratase [Pseudarcicella sp.]MBP6410029.1 GDP-mannose 4,6-dehydratase [Pseudarcicella sp.]
MIKYLITGFSGFVSQHFVELLATLPEQVDILGVSKTEPCWDYQNFKNGKISFKSVDLRIKSEIEQALIDFRPDYILHLASYSSVGYSWQNPVESFTNNTNIFLNLVEVIRQKNIPSKILSIGSSEQYGDVSLQDLPLSEERILKPISPYAVARTSQEMLSKVYADSYGIDIVMTRSFNHIGAYQKDAFVIPSFAKQLVQIKKQLKSPEITVGNLSIIRDFVDVRDVVKAYLLLFKMGKKGEIYNICSNNGISLKETLDIMQQYTKVDFQVFTDKNLVRPNDNQVIIGDNSKIKAGTGWLPQIPFHESVETIINYWSSIV